MEKKETMVRQDRCQCRGSQQHSWWDRWSPSLQPYLEEKIKEGQAAPFTTRDAGAGTIPGLWHQSMGPQHLLVLQPPQGTGVLVIVGILQVLEVGHPPDDGPWGAIGVAVGQEVAGEASSYSGQAAVQPQHPVQVESQHLVEVPRTLDEPAAPILAVPLQAG